MLCIRVTVDVGALATLASKSYKHFWSLPLANSSDIIVSENQTPKKEKNKYMKEQLSIYLYGLVYALGTSTCNH